MLAPLSALGSTEEALSTSTVLTRYVWRMFAWARVHAGDTQRVSDYQGMGQVCGGDQCIWEQALWAVVWRGCVYVGCV